MSRKGVPPEFTSLLQDEKIPQEEIIQATEKRRKKKVKLLGDKDLLRSINHEGFTVMMEYSPERVVKLIADQETFDVRFMLRTFGQRFNNTYPMEMTSQGVAPSEFQGADIIVKKVFSETALSQDL